MELFIEYSPNRQFGYASKTMNSTNKFKANELENEENNFIRIKFHEQTLNRNTFKFKKENFNCLRIHFERFKLNLIYLKN